MHVTFHTESYTQSLLLSFQLGIEDSNCQVFNKLRYVYILYTLSCSDISINTCFIKMLIIVFIYFSSASIPQELGIRIVQLKYLSPSVDAEHRFS